MTLLSRCKKITGTAKKEYSLHNTRESIECLSLIDATQNESSNGLRMYSAYNSYVSERDDMCGLGIWLYTDGKESFGEDPVYNELKQKHALFHIFAARVNNLKQAGNREEALAILGSALYKKLALELEALLLKLNSQNDSYMAEAKVG